MGSHRRYGIGIDRKMLTGFDYDQAAADHHARMESFKRPGMEVNVVNDGGHVVRTWVDGKRR
jgi:hypothetical protein